MAGGSPASGILRPCGGLWRGRGRGRAADFLALTKPRVVLMVLLTTTAGFYLGSSGGLEWTRLLQTLIGTALAAGGTVALNQFLERDVDGRMRRTRLRPLPDGRLQPADALVFGAALACSGLLYLALAVGALSSLLTASIVGGYLFVYTPLKRRTSLCGVAGAVPGALPPVVGWAAARGELGLGAWALFAIVFLWQTPHYLAIAALYRDDYAGAGIRFLPAVEANGQRTGRQVVSHCGALLGVGLLPTLLGLAGWAYFFAALGLGIAFLGCGMGLAAAPTECAARRLLFASLVYLPALLLIMALDRAPL